jgi:hypothetical protein
LIQEHKRIGKEVSAVDRSLPAVMLLESWEQSLIIAVEKFGKLQGFELLLLKEK